MVIISKSLKIGSSSNFQIMDITRDIVAILNETSKENKIENGIVNIFTKHSTSAIRVNENEKGLLLDFEKALKDISIAVPVVIDNHAIIGRSLKIEYDIPTIIGLTRQNTLGFVLESPLNNYAKDRLEKLMLTKLFK